MGATIAGALATGAATYAARKATPKTTNEVYNFGSDDENDQQPKPQMADTYLGNQDQQGQPEAQKIAPPWQKMVSGLGNSGGNSYFG